MRIVKDITASRFLGAVVSTLQAWHDMGLAWKKPREAVGIGLEIHLK